MNSKLLDANPLAATPIETPVAANTLLDDYGDDATFFYASPRLTFLGKGLHARLREPGREALLAHQVGELLAGARQAGIAAPIVAGALPFDADDAAVLFVPEQIIRAGRLAHGQIRAAAPQPLRGEIRQVPEAAVYHHAVEEALHRFATTPLEKVVLSRALEVHAPGGIDARALLTQLAAHNPNGFTFALDLFERGGHSIHRPLRLMGASPELLVSRHGRTLTANPIAGTLPRSKDPVEDEARGQSLLASVKDLHEHALVVDAVAKSLAPLCSTLIVPPKPSLIKTATLWHLSTMVHGEVADPSTSALDLAQALHPTPAVCGHPRDLAHAAIRELEPFERGLFTGMVGWIDETGDGEWAVTIRCAEVDSDKVRLFAGAGIVPASTPESELIETAAKFRTMLNAMGLEAQLEDLL
ncbi:isochorismate synthase DhbC [Jeongeupia naejangsanensis]|uniref:isochorismate synthase n=1 Tax=Jeongeupia naejangsanensis TaxID=613195 RepID=A0ABS2BGZ7_9NEIS|nr:isochorismate synthase DhbC [Jeongeupia naejangsanensis]MBM3114884.1 isochorismate synthase DhbC [Jeongeupia naejangsanensis]